MTTKNLSPSEREAANLAVHFVDKFAQRTVGHLALRDVREKDYGLAIDAHTLAQSISSLFVGESYCVLGFVTYPPPGGGPIDFSDNYGSLRAPRGWDGSRHFIWDLTSLGHVAPAWGRMYDPTYIFCVIVRTPHRLYAVTFNEVLTDELRHGY